MRKRTWAAGAVAAATGVALTLVPATAASAAPTTLNITVGGDTTVGGVAFEGMRFDVPGNITVHKGDTLNFTFAGFHTATLLPAGVGADNWRMDNTGPGGPYSLVQRDADDSALAFEFNKAVLFPSAVGCGTTSAPCQYDGKTVVNSGAPLGSNSFAVTINADPGSTFWVLCLIHAMMQTRIQVVSDSTVTTTQTQIDNYKASTLARDHEQAQSLIPKLNRQSRHKTAAGVNVWDAYAGYDGPGWGLDGMFPKTLHVRKGQWVRWHFGQLSGNLHTVTFPRSAAASFANSDFAGQNVKCESSSGDIKADAPPPTFCSTGGVTNAEFEIRAAAILTQGNKQYAGSGLHSSGVRGSEQSTAPFDLKFTKVSSKKGYTYACGIHGTMMSGTVIVTK